jgi:CxxC motif-containing protein (DUF1111 family)/cytochrome c553
MLAIRARANGFASTGLGLVLTVALAAGCAAGGGRSGTTGTNETGSAGSTGVNTTGNGGSTNTGVGTGNAGNSVNPDTGSGGGSAGATGTGGAIAGTGTGGLPGSGGTGIPVGPSGPCVPTGTTAPQLPANFYPMCSGCHSAFGTSANPVVPNLFTFAAGGATEAQFVAQVRTPPTGMLMPAFTAMQISDADIQSIYNYFKAGMSSGAVTCPDPKTGLTTANLGACSGMAASFAPLFTSTSTAAMPISYTDPTTKHLIFRGAGRVRFRHEMEDTFEIFHDHYFEDRTFAYTLDDSIPAGGSTITVTFLPVQNQYYSKQTLAGAQQGGADLNIRAWKIYGGVDGNAFAANAGGASNNVLPTNCAPDPNSPNCNTRDYTYVLNRNDRAGRAIQMGDQLQVEFGIFLARYPSATGGHVRNILPLPNGCTLNGAPYDNACYTQANYYSDSFRYVVGSGTLSPENQDCTMEVPPQIQGTGADFPHPYDCSANGPLAQAVATGYVMFNGMKISMPNRMGPVEAGWLAGTMSQPYLRQRHDLYYSQMGPAILGENAPNFVFGRRLFHTDFTTGKHIEINNDVTPAEDAPYANLAGPLYNQLDCEGCHSHNNRGVAPPAGMPFDSVVVKIAGMGKDANGGNLPDPNYGKQLQNHALTGTAEGSASFTYTAVNGTFKDGTAYTLSKPTTTFSNMAAGAPANYSVRLARPLIGMGLLEAIPEADLLAHADPTDCNGDGIKGVPNIVFDPEDNTMKVGRFGWKASKASVRMQVAEALNLDIGVTTSVFPKHDCGSAEAGCTAADTATPGLADADLMKMVTYMRAVAVPVRRDLADPNVVRGEALFASIGCVNCHVPNQHTGTTSPFLELQNQVIHPYSDLLLHDMGPDLADNNAQGEYVATSSMWRTPPLWGIGLCDEVATGPLNCVNGTCVTLTDPTLNPAPNQSPCHYLHDGRASTPVTAPNTPDPNGLDGLLQAVLWHGGEAANAKNTVLGLSAADRSALLAFLKSL